MTRKRRPTALPAKPAKRVVLLTLRGRMAGIYQIMGIQEVDPLPTFIDNVDLDDHDGSVSLIQEKPRFYLYRENSPPGDGLEFNPDQV